MSDTDPSSRRDQFEEEIAAVRIRTGKAEAEQRWTIVGLVGLVGGLVLTVVAYFTSTSMGDSRDILSAIILGIVGLTIAVVGATLFLRYSFARFLRFWLLRLIYEQQDRPGGS